LETCTTNTELSHTLVKHDTVYLTNICTKTYFLCTRRITRWMYRYLFKCIQRKKYLKLTFKSYHLYFELVQHTICHNSALI